jgi:CO/xanthine dehydrogenase FAD-binding subunit
VVEEIRLAAASLAPFPARLYQTEAALRGKAMNRGVIQAAQNALRSEAKPIDDIRSTAIYRSRVAVNLLDDFLTGLQMKGSSE